MKLLVVCSGNICRSPLAEAILRSRFAAQGITGVEIVSAGTLGIEGARAEPLAISVAAGAGYGLTDHRSRALTRELIEAADLVLVMEQDHLDVVRGLSPGRENAHLITEFLPDAERASAPAEVPDPVCGTRRDFLDCLDLIERCAGGVVDLVRSRSSEEGETEYFRTIAARVAVARGGSPELTPLEFDIVDRWWKAGTPLWLALEAIEAIASLWRSGEAPRSFMRKCETEARRRVEDGVAPRADTGSARPAGGERDEICRAVRERLAQAAASLTPGAAPLRTALERLLSRFTAPPPTLSALSEAIEAAEADLAEAAAGCVSEIEIDAWRKEASDRIAGAGPGLSAAAREKAILRLLRERLFDRFSIPSISILALMHRSD